MLQKATPIKAKGGSVCPQAEESPPPRDVHLALDGSCQIEQMEIQNAQLNLNFSWTTNSVSLYPMTSRVAQTVKCLPTTQETWVRSLGREDPLEKAMATHSSALACFLKGTWQFIHVLW